jgi:CubicO group peptidase (beta-lactamase class C family)
MNRLSTGTTTDRFERVRTFLTNEIDSGRHDGIVALIAQRGDILFHESIGQTDVRRGRAAATDDIFHLMSLSKGFVAVVMLQLIERGVIEFDTKIADVIPEFGVRGKSKVTVAHLLTHTGGTYAGFVPPAPLTFADAGDLERNVRAISAVQIAHEPGTRVVYNPFASYSMLAAVAVRLDTAGRSWRDIARDEVFVPLGMSDTSYGLAVGHPRRVPTRMAESTPGAAEVQVMESMNTVFDEFAERPGGTAFSTSYDLFRFAETLRCGGSSEFGSVLSRAMVDSAYRVHTGDLPNDFWHYNREDRAIPPFPANFTYGGGYGRGTHDGLTPLGRTASPASFGAVGSGSTMWVVDPEREMVAVFLSAGLLEGLHHFQGMQRFADVALAAIS